MNVARLLYPVKVLGPGSRVGIWLCGCDRGCQGCSNPELWHQKPEYEISVADLMNLIQRVADSHPIEGFTISGGEPMNQTTALAELLPAIMSISDDILIYTGYKLEELVGRHDLATDNVLNSITVLIDGEYIEEQNDGVALRGSSNQKIHILNAKYRERYQRYLTGSHNQIQNFIASKGVISVGIHHKGF